MCRSVPQIEATLTFTKTSLRLNSGMPTSRISAPGAGLGFTTASIFFDIQSSAKPTDSSTAPKGCAQATTITMRRKVVAFTSFASSSSASVITPLERTNCVDNDINTPQYLESVMLSPQNVGGIVL